MLRFYIDSKNRALRLYEVIFFLICHVSLCNYKKLSAEEELVFLSLLQIAIYIYIYLKRRIKIEWTKLILYLMTSINLITSILIS